MKTNTQGWIRGCLVACLLVGITSAQEAGVSIRTLQLASGKLQDSWVKIVGESEPVKLEWLTTQPTEPLKVAVEGGKLRLFKKLPTADAKITAEDVQAIQLPEGASEVLLLGWAGDEQNKYVAIKDQFLKANFNDWIAINTSPNPVALKAGDKSEPVRIDPGKSVIFRPRIEEGKGVEMIAFSPVKDKPKKFLSTYWPAYANQRTMIIFFQDGERMRAKRIGDRFVSKEEPAP